MYQVIAALNKGMEEYSKESLKSWHGRKDSTDLSPSSSTALMPNDYGEYENQGKCRRQRWYYLKGYPQDKTYELPQQVERTAAYGQLVSDFEAENAKRAGVYVGHEIAFIHEIEDVKVNGQIDLLVEDPNTKERIGIDFKSVNSYSSRKGTMDVRRGYKFFPKIQHALQCAVYLDAFRKSHDVSHWQIIYIDRGNGQMASKAHIVLLTDEGNISVNGRLIGVNISDIYNRHKQFLVNWNENTAPERDYEIKYDRPTLRKMHDRGELSKVDKALYRQGKLIKGNWHCEHCAFKNTCWSKGNVTGRK